ncbi:MAG: PAS domain-containing protein [Pseudomonadota bacterium]
MSLSDGKSRLTERQENLVSYWKSKCIQEQWPRRQDINPGDVLNALSSISLVQRSDDGFRFRLTGSSLTALFGGDLAGQFIRDIDTEVEEAGSASMEIALETGRPVYGSRKFGTQWHIWLRLPLLTEVGEPLLVLCVDEIVQADPDMPEKPSSYARREYGQAA